MNSNIPAEFLDMNEFLISRESVRSEQASGVQKEQSFEEEVENMFADIGLTPPVVEPDGRGGEGNNIKKTRKFINIPDFDAAVYSLSLYFRELNKSADAESNKYISRLHTIAYICISLCEHLILSVFMEKSEKIDYSKTVEEVRREYLIELLFVSTGAHMSHRPDFHKALEPILRQFAVLEAPRDLPEGPVRDFRPREEGIIDYIRARDGLGPWLEAGLLTRPFMREKTPKAYIALANWLRNNQLPEGMEIPTKSEVVAREVQKFATMPGAKSAVREVRRNAARLRRHGAGSS